MAEYVRRPPGAAAVEDDPMVAKVGAAPRGSGYKVRWHIMCTHLPVSFFLTSFLFMVGHVVTLSPSFELANYLTLLAGAVTMAPTALTGWATWKKSYGGRRARLFLNKIRIAFAMMGISVAMIVYPTVQPIFTNVPHGAGHLIYFAGITLLMLGSVAEGYYGGRLNHR